MSDAHQLTTFGFGILLIVISWHFIRQTLADLARDSLFDLRDQVRERFAAEGLLEHELYKRLRALLNGYLANVEKVSLFAVIIFAILKRNDAPALRGLPSRGAVDGDIQSFVRYTIERANSTTHKYLLLSSPILAVFGLPVLLWASRRRQSMHANRKALRPAVTVHGRDRARVKAKSQTSFGYPKEPINQYAQAFAEESAQLRSDCDSFRKDLATA